MSTEELCPGCQFGPTPDYSPEAPEVVCYRGKRVEHVECHRRPSVECAGLRRLIAERPRADGLYWYEQTGVVTR